VLDMVRGWPSSGRLPIPQPEDSVRPRHPSLEGVTHARERATVRSMAQSTPLSTRVAAALEAALNRALLEQPAHADPLRGPGVVVLGRDGVVISTTREADAWLCELAAAGSPSDAIEIDSELALMLLGTLTGSDRHARRTRLRTPGGTWLIAHAAPLLDCEQVVVVLEAAKASEVAPIVIEAYGLTGREVEVTQLVAHGLSTDEIASTLLLPSRSVRDHVRAVFEKVGVSSRGELTRKLFADHYPDRLH
jgi:DNA-binding CsgD family transcriptional regulator